MQLAAIYFHSVVADDEPESYSYHKFTGPVSGQIKEVYVQDGSNRQAVDYIVSSINPIIKIINIGAAERILRRCSFYLLLKCHSQMMYPYQIANILRVVV